MYRIKYLLGSMVAVFSLVYLLFGIVGWVDDGMSYADLLTTFILASVHLFGGVFLLLSSLKDYRAERLRVDKISAVPHSGEWGTTDRCRPGPTRRDH